MSKRDALTEIDMFTCTHISWKIDMDQWTQKEVRDHAFEFVPKSYG